MFLDVRIATFKGDPVRIFCAFDMRNNNILVSSILPFRPSGDESQLTDEDKARKKVIKSQSLIVTDCPDAFDDYNIAFNSNEHLDLAAAAYIAYNRQGVLIIDEAIRGRANVESVMDAKKLELGKGMVYQLDPQTTNNLHVAVLALCYAAKKAAGGANILNILNDQQEHEPYDESVMPFTI